MHICNKSLALNEIKKTTHTQTHSDTATDTKNNENNKKRARALCVCVQKRKYGARLNDERAHS